MRKGEQTRERVLEIAEEAVLAKGFSNTSIDEIIAAANLTKSGFFYHFKDKTDLAKALLERYLKNDNLVLDEIFDRARDLSDDPLHAFLIGLKLFAEMMEQLPEAHPGCMVAAIAYHDKQFNDDVRALNAQGVLAWRTRFKNVLDEIVERYPPRTALDLDHLADMISILVEGAIIISKVLGDPKVIADQVMLYRAFIQQIFLGAGHEGDMAAAAPTTVGPTGNRSSI